MAMQITLPSDQLARFCQQYAIRKLMLFGSALREDFTPQSDVDLLVEFEPDARITYLDMAAMQDELVALFGRHVDLGTPNSLSPYIRDSVLSSAQVIYEHGG